MQNQSVQQQTPEQLLMTARILWAALIFSSGLLVFLAYQKGTGEIAEFDLMNIFYGAAFVALVASHVIPRIIFKQSLALLPKPASETQVFNSYLSSFILSLALSESATLLGFLSVIKTHDPQRILPFAAAGILNMLYFFPVKDRILEKAKALS